MRYLELKKRHSEIAITEPRRRLERKKAEIDSLSPSWVVFSIRFACFPISLFSMLLKSSFFLPCPLPEAPLLLKEFPFYTNLLFWRHFVFAEMGFCLKKNIREEVAVKVAAVTSSTFVIKKKKQPQIKKYGAIAEVGTFTNVVVAVPFLWLCALPASWISQTI